MQRLMLALAGAGLVAAFGFGAALAQTAAPQSSSPKGNAAHGKQIWVSYGCYQCHGYQGQGGASSGPKIAPNPLPFDAFSRQLRKPRDRMPVYTHKTTSDQDVADLYAYVQSVPKAKSLAEIPMLNAIN